MRPMRSQFAGGIRAVSRKWTKVAEGLPGRVFGLLQFISSVSIISYWMILYIRIQTRSTCIRILNWIIKKFLYLQKCLLPKISKSCNLLNNCVEWMNNKWRMILSGEILKGILKNKLLTSNPNFSNKVLSLHKTKCDDKAVSAKSAIYKPHFTNRFLTGM